MENVVGKYGVAGSAGSFSGWISGPRLEGWEVITKSAPALEYQAKVVLFEQGALPTAVFLEDRGLIKLTRLSEEGSEVIVGLRSAGAILGAASAIAQERHPLSALTITACMLRRVDLRVFLNLARTDAEMSWYLHKMQSLEVHAHSRQLVEYRCLSARQRLEKLIWQVFCASAASNLEKPVEIRLPLKRWEVAQLIGVTPEHLSRVMKELETESIVRSEGATLVVRDIRRLCGSADI